MTEEKTLVSKYIYKGKILNLRKDIVTVRDGKKSSREIIEHRGAVAILPVIENTEKENPTIILIKQYRKAFDDYFIEIPAGKLEKDEYPEKAAFRELKEETGYIAEKITPIFNIGLSVGYSNEILHLYRASVLEKGETNFDDTEDIETLEMTLKDALILIKNQKIADSKTLIALQWEYLNILNQTLAKKKETYPFS
ncbi:MAG: NUDIX hydrolase [Clostridiales Family XIII bacterium]|jgi:ADP-ribose pyrophosphatase|nr:NUDIX hydrolase [Clostridiales Family XIII bacterium]